MPSTPPSHRGMTPNLPLLHRIYLLVFPRYPVCWGKRKAQDIQPNLFCWDQMDASGRCSDVASIWKTQRLQPNQEVEINAELGGPSISLSSLPVELQLHIIPFLDYISLRNFSQTSRHFRSLFANSVSRDIVKESLLALEKDHKLRITLLVNRDHYPCYHRLRILHAKERFSNLEPTNQLTTSLGAITHEVVAACHAATAT
jgi:F-box domain